jgi:adhesin/invasin
MRVRLIDGDGEGVSDQPVSWVVNAGGGSVNPASSATDADGFASTTWTLGAEGANSLTAAVTSAGVVTFTAMASGEDNGGGNGGGGGGGGGSSSLPSATTSTVSADPASIQVGSGESTVRVTVRDAAGSPIAGAVVTLTASGSGNTVTQPSSPTGADGVATGGLRSDVAGTKDIVATVNGSVQLTQTAQIFVTEAPASRISPVEGNNQTAGEGEAVPVAPAVQVTNSLGQPISGVGVTFVVTRGGGSVTGASQTTNADGVARVGSWTLGTAGDNRLEARSGSLNGSPVVFKATAVADQPPPPPPTAGRPDHFVFRVPPHDVGVNQWFTMEVAILDASGNVVPLDGTQIYVGLWREGSDTPNNTLLAGDRFIDTRNGVATFNLYIKEAGHYRFSARSDYLPKELGPYGPELFSNEFEVR